VTSGDHEAVVEDVLVGEVWIASGQSNMQWQVQHAADAEAEIAAADYPRVRLLQVPMTTAETPQEGFEADWRATTPETIPGFSAVAYYFGRKLHRELDVPVGLIQSAWGGTPAESWTTMKTLQASAEYAPILERWENAVRLYPEAMKKHQEAVEDWKRQAAEAREQGETPPRRPWPPRGGENDPWQPASLWNAMIHPLVPYAVRGAIWYQGESNAARAYQYRTLFRGMITDWRKAWGQDAFHFYFVQLANFMAPAEAPGDSAWAELREAQSMALGLPDTAMAVIIDIGEAGDIHPKNKQDVGKRLALPALAHIYDQEVKWASPMVESVKFEGGQAIVAFDHAEGLHTKDGGPVKGFALAGEDQQWHGAEARIEGEKVVVSSPDVAEPVAVRYAWADNPPTNLYNDAGLPAAPFRSDEWPGVTADAR
jgi:sialate O-acetylesterase